MGLFLNPRLVQAAAQHLERARASGRKRLPDLASLVLLLNACHASASRGVVHVSQAYLAERCGRVSTRTIRDWEGELVAAGLLERLDLPGRRRALGIPGEFPTGSPQVVHNQRPPTEPAPDTGGVVPVNAEPPRRYRAGSPIPPNKDRARVSQEPLQGERGRGEPLPSGELLQSAARELARTVRADVEQSRCIALSTVDLARALGPERAARALREVGPWAVREARANPAALAVQAVRARARNARGPVVVQGSLFQ